MTIRQLQKVLDLKASQNVRINDGRNYRTITSDYGWVLEPGYEYDGYNYEEVERIMKMKITGMEFENNQLIIWAE